VSNPLRIVLAGAVLAATLVTPARAGTLSGTALYLERVALPPNAVFEATLQDVSRADAPATILGRHRYEPAGGPPFRFEIAYDDAAIRPTRRYAVRATLRAGGRLLFTTDRHYAAFEGSAPLELVMVRVQPSGTAAFAPLPASFAGELPAADAAGVRWQLDLLPGDRYQLRREFVGKPEPNRFDAIGYATFDSTANRLRLLGADGPVHFERIDARTLRQLDSAGRRIASSANHDLQRSASAAPIEPKLRTSGMFVYFADSARITLCADGRSMPVANEGDYLALERAYTSVAPDRRVGLLVEVDGRIVPRKPMEGTRDTTAFIVEKFESAWPRETCGNPRAASALANTYWKLTRLGVDPVAAASRQREPHLVLRANEGRVAGSGGCNRIMGGFTTGDGDQLAFSRMASTMMACDDGMEQEQRFLQALERVARYRIRGSHLDTFDATGARVARFEAVALR
jgi:copper homeostasis protein (lipoprotein)